MDAQTLALAERDGLPEALKVLLAEYPRAAWEAHPQFSGLVQFWLDRHLMFRRLLEHLRVDAEARLDQSLSHEAYAPRLSRFGSMLVGQLHGHHQIEDQHYFPQLRVLDARLERGFDMLDRDHQALDGLLDRFADSANAVLRAEEDVAARDAAGVFHRDLAGFAALIDRHLSDEEDLIVPVILKNGPAGLM